MKLKNFVIVLSLCSIVAGCESMEVPPPGGHSAGHSAGGCCGSRHAEGAHSSGADTLAEGSDDVGASGLADCCAHLSGSHSNSLGTETHGAPECCGHGEELSSSAEAPHVFGRPSSVNCAFDDSLNSGSEVDAEGLQELRVVLNQALPESTGVRAIDESGNSLSPISLVPSRRHSLDHGLAHSSGRSSAVSSVEETNVHQNSSRVEEVGPGGSTHSGSGCCSSGGCHVVSNTGATPLERGETQLIALNESTVFEVNPAVRDTLLRRRAEGLVWVNAYQQNSRCVLQFQSGSIVISERVARGVCRLHRG